jgi:EAL domain-containing protein (putative c-di-GMP-specific phosphodiesterase class I)
MAYGRLLVLDDEESVARTIGAIAEASGFETRACTRSSDFFAAVDEGWPTHIALDLVMPAMDGVEVLRALAGRGCRATIIITSGMGTKVLEAAQRSAAERGLVIAGILPKPFKAGALRDLLDECASARIEASSRNQARRISAEDIVAALDEDRIVVHYQPKIRLSNGAAIGFEALVRMHHPIHGLILPDDFIPEAENTGTIVPLTYRIFKLTLGWLAGLATADAHSVAVNLSARHLTELELADRLAAMCSEAGISTQRINLELTETSAMTDPAAAFDILTRLRIKGFKLSIDDFGTGYSSMQQLARLPFSEIKIDKSFVMSMHKSEESLKIVGSIINLGRSLGLTTVAEGVEDEAALNLLRELGCELAQGYYFAKPMEGLQTHDWLRQWRSTGMQHFDWR